MGKKYIIELLDDCPSEFKGIIVFGLTPEGQISAEPIPVEDLTPYTEPDMEKIREEAYEDGYKTAKVQCNIQAEKDLREVGERHYQKGLSDAWDAARKIAKLDTDEQKRLFGCFGIYFVAHEYSASECIEKIRQYEQEKRFCVGDEFENESGKRFVILKMDGTEIDRYIDEEGKAYCMIVKYKVMRKTGRHFPEIAEVLQKMKES